MNQQTEKYLLNIVKRNYEEIAADFDNSRKKQLWPELIKLSEMVKDGDRVLDAGCGNGRLVGALASKKIYYLGVDNSIELIKTANKNFQTVVEGSKATPYLSSSGERQRDPGIQSSTAQTSYSTNLSKNSTSYEFNLDSRFRSPRPPWLGETGLSPRLRLVEAGAGEAGGNDKREKIPRNDSKFIVADILELDKIPETDFNYVFCIAVLHHLPGEKLRLKALEQLKNKINNNGKIIITAWDLWSQTKFRKLIFRHGLLKLIGQEKLDFGDVLFDWKNNQAERISRRYYHAFTKNELKKLAVRAGLKIEKSYQDKYNYYFILKK